MRIVMLMYLEEDAGRVADLLRSREIVAFTRLEAEGWTASLPSPWSGATTPFRSELLLTLVPEDRAAELMQAVADCACANVRHPVHGVELAVARTETSTLEARTS